MRQDQKERDRSRDRNHRDRYRYEEKDQRRDAKPERQRERDREQRSNDWRKQQRRPPIIHTPRQPEREKERVYNEQVVKVNRKEICPFSVRIFYSINNENKFTTMQSLPAQSLHILAWMDSSLREISQVMRAFLPSIRTKQKFIFWRVYREQGKPQLQRQQIGAVAMHRKNDKAQQRYLINNKFAIGDFLDVSINYK